MAVFRVGQRVRIIFRGKHFGKQATVLGLAKGNHDDRIYDGYAVDVDGCPFSYPFGKRLAPCCANAWVYESHELEPIQPEGYKVVTWAECPWQPKDWQPKREEQVA